MNLRATTCRTLRRTATITLAAGLLAGGATTALAAVPSAAARTTASSAAHPTPSSRPVNDRSSTVTYVQHGSTVTASIRGVQVAEVRYRYVSGDSGGARLTLSVTARRAFVLHTADLVWEDGTGQRTPDAASQRTVTVRPSHKAQRVDVFYTGTGPGAVVYAPGTQVAAVWRTS